MSKATVQLRKAGRRQCDSLIKIGSESCRGNSKRAEQCCLFPFVENTAYREAVRSTDCGYWACRDLLFETYENSSLERLLLA